MILEELEHAKARGARIYAEVLGYGLSADAGHITHPDEHGTGAAKAMSDALIDGRVPFADITYINAHGTSTPLGDQAETAAVKSVFKEHARDISISSTKSQLGHLLGASGGVELVLSVLALQRSVIPPTINYHTPDPLCDLDYTPNQARAAQSRGRHEQQLRLRWTQRFGDCRPSAQRAALVSSYLRSWPTDIPMGNDGRYDARPAAARRTGPRVR